MRVSRWNVTDNRTDLSQFMTHLTRNDLGETEWTGMTGFSVAG
jgi:hypothetical protein